MEFVWRQLWVHAARWVVVVALGAALTVPLLVADSLFFPYITGKNFAFRILVEIAAAAWLLLALVDARYRPRLCVPLVAFAALVGWMALANALSPNPFKAFFSNFERMEGWIGIVHVFLFFVVLLGFTQGEARRGVRRDWWRVFWHISMVVATIVALGAVGDYLNYLQGARTDPRVFSTLGNATYLAAYTLFHIFIALFYALRDTRAWARGAYALFIALQLFALYHTATRGAILGLLGGLLLTAFVWAVGGKSRAVRVAAVGVVAAVALTAGGVWMMRDSAWVRESPVLQRFVTISLSEGTVAARFMIWEMALKGAMERPLFGWGQEGFSYVFNKYYNPKMYNQEQWFDRAHNVFLDWLIAGGVPALLLYLSLYLSAVWLLWSRRGREVFTLEERAVLTGLVAAYGFNNLFVFDNLTSYILFTLLVAWIAQRTSTQGARIGGEEGVSPETVRVVVAPILIVVLLVLMWFHAQGLLSAYRLVRAVAAPSLSTEERLALLREAYVPWNVGSQEVAEQAFTLAMHLVQAGDPTAFQALQLARELLSRELTRAPNDARLLLFYAQTLETMGLTEEARRTYEKALAASPSKQQFLFAYATFLLHQGNIAKAFDIVQKAYALEPSNDEAARNVAALLLVQGKQDEARTFLLEHTNGDVSKALRLLIDALQVIGRWKEAAQLREALLTATSAPSDYLEAARAWLFAGNTTNARNILERLRALQPSLGPTIDAMLKEIQQQGVTTTTPAGE